MGNNINNNQNSNPIQNNNEVNILRNELSNANKIIEQQKSIINDLQDKLNNYNTTINNYQTQINNLQNIIIQKDLELNNLRNQSNNNNSNNVNINYNEMMSINFISKDQNIHYSIPCIKTDIFAHIEEKLYKEYPQYKETNNNFIANGKTILRFKTIAENNLVNERPVTLVVPS